jgi:hypothetical protein
MGMMLRRNNRKPDYSPQVNGKSVTKEPKKRSLTDKPATTNGGYTPKYNPNNK